MSSERGDFNNLSTSVTICEHQTVYHIMQVEFFRVSELLFSNSTELTGWRHWLLIASWLLWWSRAACCWPLSIKSSEICISLSHLLGISQPLLIGPNIWLKFRNPFAQWLEHLLVCNLSKVPKWLKSKLVVYLDYNHLTLLPNISILMGKCLTQLVEDGIKWIALLCFFRLVSEVLTFYACSYFLEENKSFLKLLVRFQGLSVEIALLTHDQSKDFRKVLILVSDCKLDISLLSWLFSSRIHILI